MVVKYKFSRIFELTVIFNKLLANFLVLADYSAFKSIHKLLSFTMLLIIIVLHFLPYTPGVSENIDGEMDHVFSGRSDEHFTVLLKDQSTQQKTQQILQKQQHTDQMMHYREQLIRQKEEILQIKRQLVEKDEVIIQKDQQILQKNQTIYEKDQQLAQKDQQLNQKDQVIYEKDQLLKQKDQKIIEMEAKLNAASKVSCHW